MPREIPAKTGQATGHYPQQIVDYCMCLSTLHLVAFHINLSPNLGLDCSTCKQESRQIIPCNLESKLANENENSPQKYGHTFLWKHRLNPSISLCGQGGGEETCFDTESRKHSPKRGRRSKVIILCRGTLASTDMAIAITEMSIDRKQCGQKAVITIYCPSVFEVAGNDERPG